MGLLRFKSQFSSVAQSRPTLCNPVDCSTPGFSVHPQLPELAQTHVHRAGDAIQPYHPPGDLPKAEIKPASPPTGGQFFTTQPPGKPPSILCSSVQLLSRVQLFATPWTAALQASMSITNSQLLKLMFIEAVMPSNHLILCYFLLLLP